jgi:hypothetical protein
MLLIKTRRSAPVRSRREDIVKKLLSCSIPLLLVYIPLARPHIAQHLAIAMCGLILLRLKLMLPLKRIEDRTEALPAFSCNVNLVQHSLNVRCRKRIAHRLIARLVSRGNLVREALDLAARARHLLQKFLERKFFAFLNAFAEAKNGRE